jgi:hypothetical protein
VSNTYLKLLKRVIALAAAPSLEGRVAAFIRDFVAGRLDLSLRPADRPDATPERLGHEMRSFTEERGGA